MNYEVFKKKYKIRNKILKQKEEREETKRMRGRKREMRGAGT